MKYRIDHDYHIHSYLSPCGGDPNQTRDAILQYAKDNRLARICVTDHYWDKAVPCPLSTWYPKLDFDHISQIKPLPQAEGIRFFFGCEGEQNREYQISVPPRRFADFDFIIIPTTHLHMVAPVLRRIRTPTKSGRSFGCGAWRACLLRICPSTSWASPIRPAPCLSPAPGKTIWMC